MNKIKKSIYWLTTIFVIPCLLYYSSKFYYYSSLSFEKPALFGWTIIVSLIIFNIIQTFLLSRKIDLQKKSLEELHKENKELKKSIIKNHYENIEYQKNTREIIMMEDKGDDE